MNLSSVFSRIGRHGAMLMPLGVILALVFPVLTDLFRPAAEPLVLIMLALSIYRLAPAEVTRRLRRPGAVLLGLAAILIATPFLVYFLGRLLGLPEGLLIIMTAWSACPPLVSVPGLAIIIGLDAATALLVMVGGMAVFPFSLPLLLSLLAGESIDIDPFSLSLQLLMLVGACVLAGQGARKLTGEAWAEKNAPAVDGLLVVCMLVFAVAIMGGLHDAWEKSPESIPLFLGAAFAAAVGLQLVWALVLAGLPRLAAGTIALASGNRNFAILLPSTGAIFGDEMWLYLAVIQFPIYILPAISKPFYHRYCRPRPAPSDT